MNSLAYNATVLRLTRARALLLASILIWWVALFPGRLGYDYALLARIIREGEQTSWWGASYFWLFKITTLNAQFLGFISLLSILALAHAISHFVRSLISDSKLGDKILLFVYLTPFFGVFGLTVSHDVFQSSGIILLTSILIRNHTGSINKTTLRISLPLCGIYLTTTQYGIVIFVLATLFLSRKYFSFFVASVAIGVFVSFISNLTIVQESKLTLQKQFFIRDLILIDLKCITQHDGAEITTEEWVFLETFAKKEAWKEKVSCSNPDVLAAPLKLRDTEAPLDFALIENAARIFSRQPAIPVMSHIQRSRVALPPPFFQPPDNQVELDVNKPIGLGTNTALQNGPGLLHPSIDDEVLGQRPSFLRPLEGIALLPAFIVNQASWFWSWGGLWFYPLMIFTLGITKRRTFAVLGILAPSVLLHLVIVLVGPSSLGRYVMSTILMGFICMVIQIKKYLIGRMVTI